MLFVKELLSSNYGTYIFEDFVKYYDVNFDILTRNKKIMFIRDKRFNQDVIYKDFNTAISNINNNII